MSEDRWLSMPQGTLIIRKTDNKLFTVDVEPQDEVCGWGYRTITCGLTVTETANYNAYEEA